MGRITMLSGSLLSSIGGGLLGDVAYEPQRTFNWDLEIDLKIPELGDSTGKVSSNIIQIALDSATIPSQSSEVIQARNVNRPIQYAGFPQKLGGGTLVVKDFVFMPVMDICSQWRNQVYNFQTDVPGLPSQYKKTGNIILVAPWGVPERIWQVSGLWPSALSFSNLNMADIADFVRITMTLEYDSIQYLGSTEVNSATDAIHSLRGT